MTKTHDEELVERAARCLCSADGRDPDKLEPGTTPYGDDTEIVDDQNASGEECFYVWRLYVATARKVVAAIEPLITRKAKEELLKQMMERAEQIEPDITAFTIRDVLRTFATEQGLNVEGGE